MKFAYDLQGNSEIVRNYPIFGNTADIAEGAVVIRGATPGTNQPFAIVGTGALADVLGVLKSLHDYSVTGDAAVDGTAYDTLPILINPFAIYKAEYDQTDTMAVASTSGTTVTITSLEDDIDGGWLYAVGGTGIGSLYFIATSASGSCTTKTATGWDSTTTVIKILPLWHQLLKINTAATMIGTDAAAGSGVVTVLESKIEADSIPITDLDPTKHNGLTGLNSRNFKAFGYILFRNHALNTID